MPARLALRELQRQFMDALLDDSARGPVACMSDDGLAPEARLRIYRRSSNEIQTASLRTSYPAVMALVGKDWFDQAARGYRRACPSGSGNLQEFGDRFGDYLETLRSCRTLPYLPDVARLEWLRQQAILAPEANALARECLDESLRSAGVSLRIVLHPSVHLLSSHHQTLTIWTFAMQPGPEKLTLDGGRENVVLWREEGQVAMAAPDPASFAWIAEIMRGEPLWGAYAEAARHDADFDPAECLDSLLAHGLVVGIRPFEAVSRGSGS